MNASADGHLGPARGARELSVGSARGGLPTRTQWQAQERLRSGFAALRGLTLRTKAITVGLYALGGVAAAAMSSLLDRPTRARAPGGDVDASSGIVTSLSLEPPADGW